MSGFSVTPLLERVLLDHEILPVICTLLASTLMGLIVWRSRSAYHALPELLPAGQRHSEDHVVIIPARNEETNLALAVNSFQDSLVLVVDDKSSDSTAAVARAAGAEVRPAKPLEQGWYGKPNACWSGALYTESKWILFADADTWYDPGFLDALFSQALREDLVGLFVFPKPEYATAAENLLLPYAKGLAFTGVHPDRVNSTLERESLGSGHCLLVRRDAYEFSQGHKMVRGSLVEGAALARLFKQHRMPVRVVRGGKFAHARMPGSFESVWRHLERTWLPGLRFNPLGILAPLTAMLVMIAWLPLLVWLLVLGLYPLAALFFFVPGVAWRGWYGSFGWSMLVPVAIYVHLAIAVSSGFKTSFGLTMEWKGRQV